MFNVCWVARLFMNDHVFSKIEREYLKGFQQSFLCTSDLRALMLTHRLSKESAAVKNRSLIQPQSFEGQWISKEDKQKFESLLIIHLWQKLAILKNPYTASPYSYIDVFAVLYVLHWDSGRESIECESAVGPNYEGLVLFSISSELMALGLMMISTNESRALEAKWVLAWGEWVWLAKSETKRKMDCNSVDSCLAAWCSVQFCSAVITVFHLFQTFWRECLIGYFR